MGTSLQPIGGVTRKIDQYTLRVLDMLLEGIVKVVPTVMKPFYYRLIIGLTKSMPFGYMLDPFILRLFDAIVKWLTGLIRQIQSKIRMIVIKGYDVRYKRYHSKMQDKIEFLDEDKLYFIVSDLNEFMDAFVIQKHQNNQEEHKLTESEKKKD